MCPTLLTCSFVMFDRKIKRSDLNVAITRPRVSTCSYIQWVPVPPKLRYRFRTGQRSEVCCCSAFLPKLCYRLSTGGRPNVTALVINLRSYVFQ